MKTIELMKTPLIFGACAIASFFAGHQTLKLRRIELVNKAGKTTMILDGQSRSLTILSADGRSQCIRLGPFYESYTLSMRTPNTRRGGVFLSAGDWNGAIALGTDGQDIIGQFPGEVSSHTVVPFWGFTTSRKSGGLDVDHVDGSHVEVVKSFMSGKKKS